MVVVKMLNIGDKVNIGKFYDLNEADLIVEESRPTLFLEKNTFLLCNCKIVRAPTALQKGC